MPGFDTFPFWTFVKLLTVKRRWSWCLFIYLFIFTLWLLATAISSFFLVRYLIVVFRGSYPFLGKRGAGYFAFHSLFGVGLGINIGIKHGFTCINIRLVPWELLKTEAGGRGFQHLPRDLANVNALKNHVQSLLLHTNWNHLLHFALFLALFCFALNTDVSRTQFPRIMLVLGPGITHLVTAANLWPRYDHIESCAAVL